MLALILQGLFGAGFVGAGVLGGGDAVRISGLAKGIYIVNGKRIMVY